MVVRQLVHAKLRLLRCGLLNRSSFVFYGSAILRGRLLQFYIRRYSGRSCVGNVWFRHEGVLVCLWQRHGLHARERFVGRANVGRPLCNRLGILNAYSFSWETVSRLLIFLRWLQEGNLPRRSSTL